LQGIGHHTKCSPHPKLKTRKDVTDADGMGKDATKPNNFTIAKKKSCKVVNEAFVYRRKKLVLAFQTICLACMTMRLIQSFH
jgi:hypothetical protein